VLCDWGGAHVAGGIADERGRGPVAWDLWDKAQRAEKYVRNYIALVACVAIVLLLVVVGRSSQGKIV
jgi:hypothetical protein